MGTREEGCEQGSRGVGWGVWSSAEELCKAPEGTSSSCWAEQPAPKWDVPEPQSGMSPSPMGLGGRSCRGTVMLLAYVMHPQGPGHLLKFSWTRCSLRYCSSDSRNFISGMMDCSERRGALGMRGGHEGAVSSGAQRGERQSAAGQS